MGRAGRGPIFLSVPFGGPFVRTGVLITQLFEIYEVGQGAVATESEVTHVGGWRVRPGY